MDWVRFLSEEGDAIKRIALRELGHATATVKSGTKKATDQTDKGYKQDTRTDVKGNGKKGKKGRKGRQQDWNDWRGENWYNKEWAKTDWTTYNNKQNERTDQQNTTDRPTEPAATPKKAAGK